MLESKDFTSAITRTFSKILIFLGIFAVSASGQETRWQSFRALETPRAEVEKVLGKPTKYFETFGRYETKFGEFTVWYTSGRCDPKGGRQQFKTEPQLLFRLLVDLPKAFTVKDFVWDTSTFNQYGYPNDDRQVHSSPDDSLAYTTGRRKNGEEYLLTASIQPGINQMHLLCEGSEAN